MCVCVFCLFFSLLKIESCPCKCVPFLPQNSRIIIAPESRAFSKALIETFCCLHTAFQGKSALHSCCPTCTRWMLNLALFAVLIRLNQSSNTELKEKVHPVVRSDATMAQCQKSWVSQYYTSSMNRPLLRCPPCTRTRHFQLWISSSIVRWRWVVHSTCTARVWDVAVKLQRGSSLMSQLVLQFPIFRSWISHTRVFASVFIVFCRCHVRWLCNAMQPLFPHPSVRRFLCFVYESRVLALPNVCVFV